MTQSAPGKPGASPPSQQSLGPDVAQYVEQCRANAYNRYSSYFQRIARWYDMYRGTYTGRRFQAFRNNISLPFLFSVIQADVARKVQTSFGSWPIVTFYNYTHEESQKARKNETLISAQMKDAQAFQKAVDFFTGADMYGTGIVRVGWDHVRQLQTQRQIGMGEDGLAAELPVSVPMDLFDGPNFDVVDILDFLPQPGKKRIDECDYVLNRYYMDYSKLQQEAAMGLWDPKLVELVKDTSPAGVQSAYETRTSVYRTYGDYDARREDKYAKPVEIWEYWGRVPQELTGGDGQFSRVITVANRTVVLRNRPNPFWHGKLPFLAYNPMPDPHYFHGPGKIEISEKMQFAANRYANQKMDALDLTIDPMWLVNRQAGINTADLFARSGRVLGVDGPIDDSVIRPLSPDLRGMQLAYQEIGTLWQWIQQGTGIIEDTVQGGQGGGDRQTAREFLGRQENVTTRLMLEARLAEEAFVEPLANMMVALNKQFLPVPKAIKILGSEAQINPITGYPIPTEQIDLQLDDINHDYRARATGATQMLNKSMRQQNIVGLLQVLQANPAAQMLINWAGMLKYTFDIFDMRNWDELLNQQPTQLNQQAQGAGPDPTDQALSQSQAAPGGPAAPGMGPQSPMGGDIPPDVMQALSAEMLGATGSGNY